MTVRHPKAQWVPAPVPGGTWSDDDGQWKFCWHDTETPPGHGRAAALCRVHRNPPQLWADPYVFELVQGISLDRSGRSLKASPHGQTNRDLVIQCEILGYHYDMGNLSRKQLEWLALVVYLPVLELGFPIAPNALQTYPTGYPNMANPSSPIRLPAHVMDNYSGQTCHEHWHGNSHTDAGGLRTDIIRDIAYGAPSPTPPPPDPEELTVADITAILSEITALRQEVSALQTVVGQQATLIGSWMQGERKWMGEGAYRIDGMKAVHVLSYQLRDDGTTTPFLQHLNKELFAMLQTGGDVDPWVQVITNPEQQAYLRSLPGFVNV